MVPSCDECLQLDSDTFLERSRNVQLERKGSREAGNALYSWSALRTAKVMVWMGGVSMPSNDEGSHAASFTLSAPQIRRGGEKTR